MPLGRIDWFGGLNKKTNKVNNYGFIKPINQDNQEKIFINRFDISTDLQPIIEAQNGEGVYIEFEIEEDNKKQKKGVNFKLFQVVGIVE